MKGHENVSLFGRCPLTTAQALIAGKWKLMIVYHIGAGEQRFSGLKRKLPDCSESILTKQLRDLEEDGLLERTVFPVVPPHVEYKLTDYGVKLIPIIKELVQWGLAYMNQERQNDDDRPLPKEA